MTFKKKTKEKKNRHDGIVSLLSQKVPVLHEQSVVVTHLPSGMPRQLPAGHRRLCCMRFEQEKEQKETNRSREETTKNERKGNISHP